MNAPAEPTPAQQNAARLTAWAVDELTADEQAEFAASISDDPVREAEAEATKTFCRMLQSELPPVGSVSALELTAEARRGLAMAAKAQKSRSPLIWALPLGAAACAALLISGYQVAQEKAAARRKLASEGSPGASVSPAVTPSLTPPAVGLPAMPEVPPQVADNGVQKEVSIPVAPPILPPLPIPAVGVPETPEVPAQVADNSTTEDVRRLFRMGLGYYDLGQFNEAEKQFNRVLALDPANGAARRQLEKVEREVNNYYRSARDHTRIQMLADVDSLWETPVPGQTTPAAPNGTPHNIGQSIVEQEIIKRQKRSIIPREGREPRLLTELEVDRLSEHPETTNVDTGGIKNRIIEARELAQRGSFQKAKTELNKVLAIDPGNSKARQLLTDLNDPDKYNVAMTESLPKDREFKQARDRFPENPFLPVLDQPLSTFSIDVDTASYAIARRHLNEGQRPPVESVRLEEMINYFPMDDAPPAHGKPFAVHVETASAPWAAEHRLVRVALKGKVPTAEVRRPANLVFLVDTSGSMDQPNKLPLVQQSLRLLLDQLEPRDLVTLVTYAGDSELKLPATPVSERARIAAAIDALRSGGSTNGSGGITTAYQQARAHLVDGGVNRVILATDGDFNVGLTSETDLQTLIAKEAKSGVYLSVLAYGSDNLKDTTAELLADKGNGNYAYIDSLSEARRALVTQLQGTLVTIAKDVKIQVEFNPALVAQYRLLGYENRALANKDFNDDTKDAGEIGAGHSVTALYEIIPAGLAAPLIATVDPLKYQTTPPAPVPPPGNLTKQAATGELLTVKLRYQQPEGTAPSQLIEVPVKDPGTAWREASANFRWTAAVAGYGMLLRESTHAGDLTWETVRTLATGAKGPDPDGFRGEFLQLIEKAAGLVPTSK